MCLQYNVPLNPVFSVFAEEIGGAAFDSPSQESDFEILATMLAGRRLFGSCGGPGLRDSAVTVPAGGGGRNARYAPSLEQTPAESGEMSEEVLELGGKRCKFGAIEIWKRRPLSLCSGFDMEAFWSDVRPVVVDLEFCGPGILWTSNSSVVCGFDCVAVQSGRMTDPVAGVWGGISIRLVRADFTVHSYDCGDCSATGSHVTGDNVSGSTCLAL